MKNQSMLISKCALAVAAALLVVSVQAREKDVKGNGKLDPGLSHFGLYTASAVTPVPEPKTYALMLAGVGAVFFLARRRRPQD